MANVPIVTEVTKAQLDALVAANGLNEGLQYKVTDKGWLLTATGANTYIFSTSVPYKSFAALANQSGTANVVLTIFDDDNGNIDVLFARNIAGTYIHTFSPPVPVNKFFNEIREIYHEGDISITATLGLDVAQENVVSITIVTNDISGGGLGVTDDLLINFPIGFRIYF